VEDGEREESGWRPRETPYQAWQKGEGIPIYRGSYVADLYGLELAPWARAGQQGAFINLAEQEHDDSYVLEIAPGEQTHVLHHLFEATIYVLSGRGATTIWQDPARKQTVEWQKGSVFSPPLNCYYQHFNVDGRDPARLFAVTNAPMMINMVRNSRFVFNDTYVFDDRYAAEDGYFTDPGVKVSRNTWKTNFIADIRAFMLDAAPNRGAGGGLTQFSLSNNGMIAHCSQFPPGTYKKAHRHGVGAHVVILDGHGYSLLWFKGEERRRVDWKDGTVLSPKNEEFHQHFNTGPVPARYAAFRLGALDVDRVSRGAMPDQIEYEEEAPTIYEEYARECAKHGAEVVLPRPAYATV
jgi:gentisate 1,2-dioxygenase